MVGPPARWPGARPGRTLDGKTGAQAVVIPR